MKSDDDQDTTFKQNQPSLMAANAWFVIATSAIKGQWFKSHSRLIRHSQSLPTRWGKPPRSVNVKTSWFTATCAKP